MARDYSYEAFRDLLDQIREENITMETDRTVAPGESIFDDLQDPAFRESERKNAGFFEEEDGGERDAPAGTSVEEGPQGAPMDGQPREVTKRFQLDRYQITGNHFQGALNTWHNFADKNNPENCDFKTHAKMDENKAVNVVMKEIARYGSLKVSFDKEINFKKEKEERGLNGEVQFDKISSRATVHRDESDNKS